MNMPLLNIIRNSISRLSWKYLRKPLYISTIPMRVKHIRKKERIKVLFAIADLGTWKTENLYKEMLSHQRFDVYLLLLPSLEDPSSYDQLKKYLETKSYIYYTLKDKETIQKRFSPDIIFYQKPYGREINIKYFYIKNLRSLFCFVNYAFHSINDKWACNCTLHNLAWQVYYENDLCWKELIPYNDIKGKNSVVTGLPITDQFIKFNYKTNPWKKQSLNKKRIIWAPHHSIPEFNSWISYSTFTNYYKFMLILADKYADQIQIAFKPHPLLKNRLLTIWDEEKIDAYYHEWEIRENTQLELGEYISLFMNSDALIHDCSSFTIEYHYTKNPVLYLEKDIHHQDNLNSFAHKAYELHYKGHCEKDIEQFILNVINNEDPLKEKRIDYYNNFLMPPNGKSACENIIDAILGNNPYN